MCSGAVPIGSHWHRSIAGWAAYTWGPARRCGAGMVAILRRRRPEWRPGAAAMGRYTQGRAREDRTVAGRGNTAGGKSGLRRAGCWLTARGGDPTESATETYRRREAGKGETVR